jgi:23S rRNA (cytidine1920-2'-O)/16S rRNA (cytidine1409-2'-O)-methyltransferase
MGEKERLDLLLVRRGLASSRERAQALILGGHVLVNDSPVTKPGTTVGTEAVIRLRREESNYVSRGAHKLIAALDQFSVDATGREALDIGASTGGFTQVLLERGATRVYAIDVGHNQLDWKIRQDSRVVVLEKLNARYLAFDQIGHKAGVIVTDVSFISLERILPALPPFMDEKTDLIALIKPQFEVGREKVGKGGIVRSEEDRQAAVAKVTTFAETIGLERRGLIESPITGTDGNQEFLAHWKLRS